MASANTPQKKKKKQLDFLQYYEMIKIIYITYFPPFYHLVNVFTTYIYIDTRTHKYIRKASIAHEKPNNGKIFHQFSEVTRNHEEKPQYVHF